MARFRRTKHPEEYRDRSGEHQAKGKAFGKLILLVVLTVLSSGIDAYHPFGWDLPFDWPLYFFLGCIAIGFYGIQMWFRLLIATMSTWAGWPTGKAPLNKRKPVSEPFFPDQKTADQWGLYIWLDANTKYYYPFRVLEVQGTDRIISWPGHDFLVIPWIVLPQTVLDARTGRMVVREVNYSLIEWGPDLITLNGDTTWARQHKKIPLYMRTILQETRGFRPDVSIDGTYRGATASRVDFALYPKYNLWNLQPLRVPTEAKDLSKLKASIDTVAVEGADAALTRQSRIQRDMRDRSVEPPAPSQRSPDRRREYNEEEEF